MSMRLPLEIESSAETPALVQGYLSVKSKGGKSCLDLTELPKSTTPFHADSRDRKTAEKVVVGAGLTIEADSPLGLAVSGPPEAFEELTGGKVVTRERLLTAEAATKRYVTHLDIVGKAQPTAMGVGTPSTKSSAIEAVILERPRIPMADVWPTPMPPSPPGFYLRVPQDIATGLAAKGAHAAGHRGKGVLVAMVDTGQYAHTYFVANHYSVRTPIAMVKGTSRHNDPVGHGTGESANIFAVAPEADLQPIRVTNDKGDFIKAIGGFMRAKSLNPKVLTNSWGGDLPLRQLTEDEITWALEIQNAVEQGIFVVFSAGNGQFSLEPQVPSVFAAGGVYMDKSLRLQASTYASGYRSPFFANRIVPDACGLVGMLPRADYIMLPVQPGCQLDKEMSEPDEDNNPGDGTPTNDGWARFSGTSAAAPQIAGVAALILSAKPKLKPDQVKQAITVTATDVVVGRSNPIFNSPAGPGQDEATGFGLVNASAAVEYAVKNF